MLTRWQATLEQLKGSLRSRKSKLAVWLFTSVNPKGLAFLLQTCEGMQKEKSGENEKCSQRNGILCIFTFPPYLSCLFSLSSPFSLCSLPWYIYQWVDKKEKKAFPLWFVLKFPNTVPRLFSSSLTLLGRGFLLLLGGAKFQLRNFGFQLPTRGFKKIPSAGILATTASLSSCWAPDLTL